MDLMLRDKMILVADDDMACAQALAEVLRAEDAIPLGCVTPGCAHPDGFDAVLEADLADLASAQALRDAVAGRYGRLDAVVWRCFSAQPTSVQAQSADGFLDRLRPARSAFVTAKVFGGWMGELGGGAMVYVTTLHDEKPNGSDFTHSVVQGMVANLVMEAAMEYGQYGVRVNQIAMGPLQGDGNPFPSDISTFYEGARHKIPLGRLGSREDLAAAAVFLCSPRAAFTNGARLRMDGALIHHYVDPRANYRAHLAQGEGRP